MFRLIFAFVLGFVTVNSLLATDLRLPEKESRVQMQSYLQNHPEVLRDLANCYDPLLTPENFSPRTWAKMKQIISLAAATRDLKVIDVLLVQVKLAEEVRGKHPAATTFQQFFGKKWNESWQDASPEEIEELEATRQKFGLK